MGSIFYLRIAYLIETFFVSYSTSPIYFELKELNKFSIFKCGNQFKQCLCEILEDESHLSF